MTKPITSRSYEQTPWGQADHVTHYADGIDFFSTPSHGGFRLSMARLIELTAKLGPIQTFCGNPQWFEEDCDYAHVMVAFPEYFTPEDVATAQKSIDFWKQQKGSEGVAA